MVIRYQELKQNIAILSDALFDPFQEVNFFVDFQFVDHWSVRDFFLIEEYPWIYCFFNQLWSFFYRYSLFQKPINDIGLENMCDFMSFEQFLQFINKLKNINIFRLTSLLFWKFFFTNLLLFFLDFALEFLD